MMRSATTVDLVKVFLLGMITAFLAVIALRPNGGVILAANKGGGAMAGQAGSLIALTGPSDASLFLVDTTNKHIAQYAVDNSRFSLRAARAFKNDLWIKDINRKGGIDLKTAEKEAKKSMDKKN